MSIKAFAAGVGTCSVVFLGVLVTQDETVSAVGPQHACPPQIQQAVNSPTDDFSDSEPFEYSETTSSDVAYVEEPASEMDSDYVDELAEQFEGLDEYSENANDLLSEAYNLNSAEKRALVEEFLSFQDASREQDAVRVLMTQEYSDEKVANVQFLSQYNLSESAQTLLFESISDDLELMEDPTVASWVQTVVQSTPSGKVRAAAIAATPPSDATAKAMVGNLVQLLASSDTDIVQSGLLATERWLYNDIAAIAPSDLARIKTRVMSIANDSSADVEARIQALSVSRDLP